MRIFIEVDDQITISMSNAKMSFNDKLKFAKAFKSIGNVILREIEAKESEVNSYELDELKVIGKMVIRDEWSIEKC